MDNISHDGAAQTRRGLWIRFIPGEERAEEVQEGIDRGEPVHFQSQVSGHATVRNGN